MAPPPSSRHGTERPMPKSFKMRRGCADRHPNTATAGNIDNDALRLEYLLPDFHMLPPVIGSVL
jgi:hypothetical protein